MLARRTSAAATQDVHEALSAPLEVRSPATAELSGRRWSSRRLRGIPVRARIARATGDELTDTYAVVWTRQLVLVQFDDRRLQLRGVWFAAADVRPRPGKTPAASPT